MPTSPLIELNDGNTIPQIGFGSAFLGPETAERVRTAIDVGYRHIDTARAYGNDAEVAEGIRMSGLPRSEIFITSKLLCEDHGYDATLAGLDAALDHMALDYLDLFLIHWPNPEVGLYIDSWRAMIRLRDEGRIRSIGVSNFGAEHVDRLIAETGVKPVVNQVELNPRFQQRQLRESMSDRDVLTECWSPLVHGTLLQGQVYQALATKHGRSPAQIVLRWHIQQGLIVIPKAEERPWMQENLAITDFALDAQDMALFDGLDEGEAGRNGPHPTLTTAQQRREFVEAAVARFLAEQQSSGSAD